MLKKTVLFVLAISLLTLLNACASEQAAQYTNGAGTEKTVMPETSGLQVSVTEAIAAEIGETAVAEEMAEKVETSKVYEASLAAGIPDAAADMRNALLDRIANTDASYFIYDSDIFGADYDGDGKTEYFIVFTEKGSKEKDTIGCSADIWLADENVVKRVVEWQCIEPDKYGSLKLAGKYYFRYDLAFATELQTILLSVKDENNIESYNCLGYAEFGGSTDDFTVTCSTYDMVYLKSDKLTCGHTWKKYYFYADVKGFHEYGAVKIAKKEFLRYPEADTIIKEISRQYEKEGTSVTIDFLKRCNGLIHININCETKDDITHYYRTYGITQNNTLIEDESGEGSYVKAISENIAEYK